MSATRTALVLGGGVGGIVAAHYLRRRLPSTDRVILVDRGSTHAFQPSFLWLAVGRRQPAAITRSLDRLTRHRVEVVTGEVTRIDPENKTVQLNGTRAPLAPEVIPGLAAAGRNLYTLDLRPWMLGRGSFGSRTAAPRPTTCSSMCRRIGSRRPYGRAAS
jgi:NADPH-dependent 2,4-dienoyl-CoA reductase/sulfur reductase-like enzyme